MLKTPFVLYVLVRCTIHTNLHGMVTYVHSTTFKHNMISYIQKSFSTKQHYEQVARRSLHGTIIFSYPFPFSHPFFFKKKLKIPPLMYVQ